MKKSNQKAFNVFCIIFETVVEIVLLPFHIIKAIFDVIAELRK